MKPNIECMRFHDTSESETRDVLQVERRGSRDSRNSLLDVIPTTFELSVLKSEAEDKSSDESEKDPYMMTKKDKAEKFRILADS